MPNRQHQNGPAPQTPRVGYVGVDVLNNATVCNEALGLLSAGVPLDVVSVYRHEKATFYRDATLEPLRRAVHNIFPARPLAAALALGLAPFRFGGRFWAMAARGAFGPAESFRRRLTLIYQMVPALLLATHWRGRGVGHIHAHWAHTATAVAMHAAELLGVGFSFTGHANDLFVHRVGLRAKVRRARFVVCISDFHRTFYRELGADPARLAVVYCGIDTARFRAPVETARANGERPRVLAVGRLVEKKGFADLIAACGLLRDGGLDFTCTVAGSGPELGTLRAAVERAGLGSVVSLTGATALQEDLPGLLAASDVFALPCVRDRDGDMDGLPQVLIEALLCGVPVVSTRLVGIPDLVRPGRTGLLVEPGDVPALAEALRTLLTGPALATRLGAQGRAWALAHFGLDESVRRLARHFQWAAETPGHSAPPFALPPAPDWGEVEAPEDRAQPVTGGAVG